jgi:hypothetical protein
MIEGGRWHAEAGGEQMEGDGTPKKHTFYLPHVL